MSCHKRHCAFSAQRNSDPRNSDVCFVSACVQVEVWSSGLASVAPEALLVGRQEVKALNKVILSKVGSRSC